MSRQRPVPLLLGMDGPSLEIPGWVAAWLERETNLTSRRVAVRGADPGVDDVLAKLHYIAMRHLDPGSDRGTDSGTSLSRVLEPAPPLDEVGVSDAAGLIGITDRAVRKAITEQRLPARLVAGRWLIDRTDALNYPRRTA